MHVKTFLYNKFKKKPQECLRNKSSGYKYLIFLELFTNMLLFKFLYNGYRI